MLTANSIKSVATGDPRETVRFPTTTRAFVHIVTLINRRTGEEAGLEITTLSDRFTDVMREITHQKVMHGLIGFEVYETLDCNLPF